MNAYLENGQVSIGSKPPRDGTPSFEVESQSKELRDAWVIKDGQLDIDLDKAKDVVHTTRRTKRNKAFESHDKIIALHGMFDKDLANEAEDNRISIREADDKLQIKIDKCRSVKTLKKLMVKEEL